MLRLPIISIAILLTFSTCSNQDSRAQKRALFIRMAEEKGLVELLGLTEEFPDPTLTKEKWAEHLDYVGKLEKAYQRNQEENRQQKIIQEEMYDRLEKVKQDRDAHLNIISEYAAKYDWVVGPEEGNMDLPATQESE